MKSIKFTTVSVLDRSTLVAIDQDGTLWRAALADGLGVAKWTTIPAPEVEDEVPPTYYSPSARAKKRTQPRLSR